MAAVKRDEAAAGPLIATYPVSVARPRLSPLLDEVQEGRAVVIERRGFKALVTSLDAEEKLLARCYGFNPEVHVAGSGSVGIWLPELTLHAQGATLEEAEDDLVDAVTDYVADWHSLLRNAPNHADRHGWVQRIMLAADHERIKSLLFPS